MFVDGDSLRYASAAVQTPVRSKKRSHNALATTLEVAEEIDVDIYNAHADSDLMRPASR